ncbi:MAG: glycerophosphodiester phosphodiesterase [Candidatus Aquirickettsiella sp.]
MFPLYKVDAKPLVIAHRGGAGLWPENTLFALQEAAKIGVDLSEIDIHMTRDGVLVAIHDESVDRTTNAKGLVQDLTFAELKKLDAGYRWTNDEGRTFPFRGQGIKIPSLNEIFAAFPKQVISIEIKQNDPPIIAALRQLINYHNKTKHVLVSAFNSRTMKVVRRLCPAIATAGTQAEMDRFSKLSKLFLTRAFLLSATALEVPCKMVTAHFIKAAHKKNIRVDVWTVNEIEEMERLLALEVDGILTDFPDRMLNLVRKA